jgi:phosphomannomutase
MVPTPTVLLLTRHLGCRGGIAITASHNPAEWNALKFVDRDGLFLDESRTQELLDIYHQQDFPLVAEADLPAVAIRTIPWSRTSRPSWGMWIRLDPTPRFKVAVDGCNGVGALHSSFLLGSLLGCEVVPVFDTPSGIFQRNPEPMPQHLGGPGEPWCGRDAMWVLPRIRMVTDWLL